MGVNIWVTGADGERMPICWGVGLVPTSHSKGGYVINFLNDSDSLKIRETPAEIMALIAAEERKQQRREIAAKVLAALMAADPDDTMSEKTYSEDAVSAADALLAALEGAE